MLLLHVITTTLGSGEAKIIKCVDKHQFDDDGTIFGEVLQLTMWDFYDFKFERQGYYDVSKVTISIKNLRI